MSSYTQQDMDQDECAVLFSSGKLRTLQDGTLKIEVTIEPMFAMKAFEMFSAPGTPGAIARLTVDAAKKYQQNQMIQEEAKDSVRAYGEYAKKLKQSMFFRSQDVLRAIGKDSDYQAWCRTQKCAVTAKQDFTQPDGRCVYAHVRRADSSGTGYKPIYKGMPLLNEVHQLQHQKGEREALLAYANLNLSVDEAKAWFDKRADEHLQRWAWERLKGLLNYNSWANVPPSVLVEWAKENEVFQHLPLCYREWV
ncbi:hypothetical protein [Algicola sagamiensis]|uniref:hypothetical protein n=1 Tax=Algicola sagamiensis TaxID=163869 RepID=UPI000361FA86|nr:hypothetical protein [Algicola sagamiensis]